MEGPNDKGPGQEGGSGDPHLYCVPQFRFAFERNHPESVRAMETSRTGETEDDL